ncbi:MAG: Maf family nucleotide pyrophosphatase [Thermonemataceae bacterium]|nr:Maf family nucleotide pyrophosphatase [Thermonemataceae bacterium]
MYLIEKFAQKKIILASASPRRKQLLEALNIPFRVESKQTEESFSEQMLAAEVPIFLAEKKAIAFFEQISNEEIVISADTIVIIDNQILNKPSSKVEAQKMLEKLSGRMHEVITGFCILSKQKKVVSSDTTKVFFRKLTTEEMSYYIGNQEPYDKAGAYGAQDWLGMVGIERIEGSYFNVMGLPVHLLYQELLNF